MDHDNEETPAQALAAPAAAATNTTPNTSSSSAPSPSSLPSIAIAAAASSPSINIDIHNRLPSNHISPTPKQNSLTIPGKKHALISQSIDIYGHDNFPMGCTFSPDGTCVLTATASDGKFRLYDTPYQYLNGDTLNAEVGEDNDNEQDENDKSATTTAIPQHETKNEAQDSTVTTYSHNQNYQPPPTHETNQKEKHDNKQQQHRSPHPWKASLTSHQGGPAPSASSSSYAWYPLMTSSSPLTSLYATCRGHSTPIHLIDAYTSQLRASYRPYNGVDEMEGPTVVDFSPDGRRIYGTGFRSDRTIAVFDTSIPGREGMIARLGKTRRSSDGQKGIPSAMAFPKCYPGGNSGPSNVFAVGTYSPASIYIYDDRMSSRFSPAGTIVLRGGLTVVGHGRSFSRKKRRFGQIDNGGNNNDQEENLFSSARVNWFQSRARGGVTQLMWAPPSSANPYVLFSASRRSNTVLSWDVRCLSGKDSNGGDDDASRPICGLQSYARDGEDTNQRLEFDLDGSGERMFAGSGSGEGVVKIYDVKSGALEGTLDVGVDGACKDAVNGVSYFSHSSKSHDGILAVAVGSRRFRDPESDDDDDGDRLGEVELSPGSLQLHSLQ